MLRLTQRLICNSDYEITEKRCKRCIVIQSYQIIEIEQYTKLQSPLLKKILNLQTWWGTPLLTLAELRTDGELREVLCRSFTGDSEQLSTLQRTRHNNIVSIRRNLQYLSSSDDDSSKRRVVNT